MRNDEVKHIYEYINEVADAFYQNKNREGLEKMPELIKNLATLMERIPQDQQAIYNNAFKNIIEAYEQGEYVMIADILVFDVLEQIKGIL